MLSAVLFGTAIRNTATVAKGIIVPEGLRWLFGALLGTTGIPWGPMIHTPECGGLGGMLSSPLFKSSAGRNRTPTGIGRGNWMLIVLVLKYCICPILSTKRKFTKYCTSGIIIPVLKVALSTNVSSSSMP